MMPTFFVRLTAISLACLLTLTGCASGSSYVPLKEDVPPVEGPPVTDVVTPFDRAISCLDGQIHPGLTFSVGAILDATGKEQLSEGGTGKFITQGAGDIVQSALFQAGTTVLNRRDPRVMETEARWGVRDTKGVLPSVFFITGSINSLDFIPGGGFEAQIAGVGPRYRQYRIVVGLDLSLTETRTGRIVANVPLQKQIVASEAGFGVGRFFGDTLVSLDMGTQRREAVSFALRQMLNLATYELLTQLMKPELYSACSGLIEGVHGVVNSGRASRKRVITIPSPSELLPGAKPVASKPPAVQPAVPANGTPALAMAAASDVAAPSRAAQLQVVGGVAMEPAGQGSDAFVAAPPQPVVNTPPAVEPQPEPAAKPAAVAPEPKEPPVSEVKVEPVVIATAPAVEAPPAVVEVPPAVVEALPPVVEAPPAVVEAPPPVVEAPPPVVEAQPEAPAPVVADKENAVDATCSYPSGPSATVRPAKGFKSGNMVYVESDTASSLCVVDATGKFTRHQFKPGKGQVFNGRPPWKLSSPDLLSMRIFFQGVNLARIMPNSTSIVLQETSAPQASGGLASVVIPDAVAPEPNKPSVSEVKVEPTVIASAPAVEAPPEAPAPVVADKEKAVDATCRYPSGPYVTVRLAKGFKPGDMVYVESDTASSLCVVDATGKFTRHRFKPGKGQAFNGTPPWKLESPDLLAMRIYFQGVNLARIMPNSTSIVLQETAASSEQ